MGEMGRDSGLLMGQLEALGIPGTDAGVDMRDLYARSSRLELPLIDYLTIRDLLELSGCQGDAPLVAVLMAMFAALEEGSLCLNLEPGALGERLGRFLEGGAAQETGALFLLGLSQKRYKGLISGNGEDYLPLILSERNGRTLLYFQKFHVHETRLREKMETLLTSEPKAPGPKNGIDSIIEAIYAPDLSIRLLKGGPPIDRDTRQEEALRLSLQSRFCIISGGPGTGKTSLMVNMLRCLVRSGVDPDAILLGAPTGRAAQRMTEAVQQSIETILSPEDSDRALLSLKGSTLHKLLRYRRSRHDFYYGEANPLPESVIILDEVSMVDVIMMERFLRAVDPARTRLIFLGDKDQLPSVEAGAVLAEMIPDGRRAERFKGRLVVLDTVYRSGKNLIKLAGDVNVGAFPEHQPIPFALGLELPGDGWGVVENEGIRGWRRDLQLWVDHHYLNSRDGGGGNYLELITEAGRMDVGNLVHSEAGEDLLDRIFERVQRARVLSLLRNGIYGCIGSNREIAGRLAGAAGHSGLMEQGHFPGAMIMITRNDYARELFNGDVGVIIADGDGVCRAFFPRYGGYIAFSMDMLPPWELAFAMTVHKSQGSEFDDVLLVLPPNDGHRLLTREIIYTGITRARERVLIYGTGSALNAALARRIERISGLEW